MIRIQEFQKKRHLLSKTKKFLDFEAIQRLKMPYEQNGWRSSGRYQGARHALYLARLLGFAHVLLRARAHLAQRCVYRLESASR